MLRKVVFLGCAATLPFLGSCAKRVFGVDESVWMTLNEKEREQVIDGYNRQQELKIANRQKEREQELENERQRQELEAKNAPFKAVADVVSTIAGNTHHHICNRIQSIKKEHHKTLIQIENSIFEVSPFCSNVDHWMINQPVKIGKSTDLFYNVSIANLDNGEIIQAKRK